MYNEDKNITRYSSSSLTKPQYKASYEKELGDLYDKLSSRDEFKYEADSDALYKQYRDDYIRRGRLAMRDTIGQAAALTGGYGSSYAENVGRQSYDAYLEKLGAVVPELYTLAYSRYQDEGDALRERYDITESLRDREYKEYTDAMDDYNNAHELAYKREQEELEREREEKDKEYQRAQNEAAARAKYGDFDGYAALYGTETAGKMREYWIAANPSAAYAMGLISIERYYTLTGTAPSSGASSAASSSSSKRTTYYPNTAPDGRDAAVVQRELRNKGYNIAVDGAWGERSQKAWDKEYGTSGSKSTGKTATGKTSSKTSGKSTSTSTSGAGRTGSSPAEAKKRGITSGASR